MQSYVKKLEGADGPPKAQNAQDIVSSRQTLAAKAKVSTRNRPIRSAHSNQPYSGIPSRGPAHVQNTSATIQHVPHRRVSGQPQKRDLYDTDAESIDTTVNQSVIQGKDDHQGDQQSHQPQPGHVGDLSSESRSDGDGSDDEEGDEEYDEEYNDGFEFTEEDVEYLKQQKLEHLTRSEAFAFLQQAQPGRFRTIDGDSYPTTTEGDPNERQGDKELTSENCDDGGHVSPSPQRHVINGRRPLTPPSMHRGPMGPALSSTVDRPHALFNQSAAIRNQQRANISLGQQSGHLSNDAPMMSTQLPTYPQVNRETFRPQVSYPKSRPNHQVAFQESQKLQQSIPQSSSGSYEYKTHSKFRAKRPFSAPSKEVPIIRSSVEQPPVEQVQAHPDGDYDLDTLHAMKYDQLKNESFDIDPRAPVKPLSQDMLKKPLVDRLEHVQHNLEPLKQSEFFKSLPNTEWEDAGDWFLDQFSSIIARTREARQRKRKLAQSFEDEIEKRHKHVSKKQHQVEDAMNKMKAQGEGLVPKSPRRSKSPRPKR